MVKYRCLVLDHDDTSVDSTPTIHYPAYLEMMRELRPDITPRSLDEFFAVNHDPGYFEHMRLDLRMSEREIEREVDIWRQYVAQRVPAFFDGILDLLKSHRARGGAVAVVSHSEREIILRDYCHGDDSGFLPDIIHGWDPDPDRRKPSAYPLRRILDELHLAPVDVLVVDDLLPGITMARALGVDAVAAGWGHRTPAVHGAMERENVPYLQEVSDLAVYLSEGG